MSMELRARAATAIMELAFNPHQRRDSRGRWVKMPDSELKRPRRGKKVSIEAALRGAMAPGAGGKIQGPAGAAIAQLFEVDDPQTGLKATAHQSVTMPSGFGDSNKVWVPLTITNRDGQEAGRATRYITQNAAGELEVEHALFQLAPEVQGGGFSSRWLKEMEQRYKDAGIKRIYVNTDDVGGYAWAKAGFDFVRPSEAKSAAIRLELRTQGPDTTPEIRAQVADLKRRAKAGGDQQPTPMEFAMVGWTPGATDWVGKRTMLNSNWRGVKQL
jgi:GNAT superfamily N-acetyltransferase